VESGEEIMNTQIRTADVVLLGDGVLIFQIENFPYMSFLEMMKNNMDHLLVFPMRELCRLLLLTTFWTMMKLYHMASLRLFNQ
jgi:hypothetical protein